MGVMVGMDGETEGEIVCRYEDAMGERSLRERAESKG